MFVRPTTWITSRGYRGGGVAVIAAIERQNFVFTGVQTRHANRVFVCIGTAISKENLVEVSTSAIGDQLGSFRTSIVSVLRSNRGEFGGLILNCLHNFWMLETDIGKYQLAREIQILVALVIPEITSQPPSNWHRANQPLGRPGVKHVGAI